MSPRTEEQFEEIRREKKQLIMDTAIELFAQNGYGSTSISEIAKKGGISKGLLYNYFKSKEELLEAILNKGIDDMLSVFDPNKDGLLEPHELEYFITELINMIKINREFWKLYWGVMFQPSAFKLIEKRIAELYEPLTQILTTYFNVQGFKNPMSETLIFGAILDGITLDFIMAPDIYPIDIVKNELIDRYCKPKNNK